MSIFYAEYDVLKKKYTHFNYASCKKNPPSHKTTDFFKKCCISSKIVKILFQNSLKTYVFYGQYDGVFKKCPSILLWKLYEQVHKVFFHSHNE